MRTTLRPAKPLGIRIELDSSEIIPSDPGAGTPAMVYVGNASGTFWCALDTGEVDDFTLTDSQHRWLSMVAEQVDAFIEAHS